MLNLPQKTLSSIKKYLLRKQKEVNARLKTLDEDDPVLAKNIAEAPESGTESWAAEAHRRLTSVKNDLMDLSKRITKSLYNLRKGTYGVCERCGKRIEPARLTALPTATLCLNCSKKSPSKR